MEKIKCVVEKHLDRFYTGSGRFLTGGDLVELGAEEASRQVKEGNVRPVGKEEVAKIKAVMAADPKNTLIKQEKEIANLSADKKEAQALVKTQSDKLEKQGKDIEKLMAEIEKLKKKK